jgi:hypothetical protein
VAEFQVLGSWSLETSWRFWEGFTPQHWQARRPCRGCVRCSVPRVTASRRGRGDSGRRYRAWCWLAMMILMSPPDRWVPIPGAGVDGVWLAGGKPPFTGDSRRAGAAAGVRR